MVGQAEFLEAFDRLHATLEKRRRHYLTLFYVNSMLAAMLLVAALLFPAASLQAIAALLHHTRPVSRMETASFLFFGCFAAAALVLTPLLRYHGGFKAQYSWQRVILLQIAELLGNSTLSSPAASFEHVVRESGMFPEHAGIAETVGIKGVTGAMHYSLQEIAVASSDEEILFRGMVAVYAPQKRRLTALVEERRRSLLMDEEQVSPASLLARGWENAEWAALPSDEGRGLQAVSTHPAEAQAVFTAAFLTGVSRLAELAAALPGLKVRFDNRQLTRLQQGADNVREWLFNRSRRAALPAEEAYDAQFQMAPAMLAGKKLTSAAFRGKFAVAQLGDTVMVAFPSEAGMFQHRSLFDPALGECEARFLYQLVSTFMIDLKQV